jgi:hypothetical protein
VYRWCPRAPNALNESPPSPIVETSGGLGRVRAGGAGGRVGRHITLTNACGMPAKATVLSLKASAKTRVGVGPHAK